MTASSSVPCPSCGSAASGNFCASCGTALAEQHCTSCGAVLAPAARFCQKCGAQAGGAARAAGGAAQPVPGRVSFPRNDGRAWAVAGVLIVVTILGVVYFASRRPEPSVPSMANAGNAVPGAAEAAGNAAPVARAPDISNMTPKEQYNRLVARISRAEEAGDSVTIINFTPMALGAYANLPPGDRDIDARFHAATMQVRAGMLADARALADTIMKESPDNLLGYYVRAVIASRGGDAGKARAARAAFRAHFDAGIKQDRPEYKANRPLLERYRQGDGAR